MVGGRVGVVSILGILAVVFFCMGDYINYMSSCESMGVSKEDALEMIIKPIRGARNGKNIRKR